jgi:hypothetical protein
MISRWWLAASLVVGVTVGWLALPGGRRPVDVAQLRTQGLIAVPARAALDVRDHGAVGDGVTDDRTAIQATLAAAAQGDTVTLPIGTYLVGQGAGAWCLTVPVGVTLHGESRDGTVLLMAPGIADSVRLLQIDAPGVAVEDLTLDGNRAAQTADEHRAGVFSTAADTVIRRVTARAFTGDGFYFYGGADRFVVDHALSIWHGRNGMTVGGAVAGGRVTDSQFFDSHAQQFDSEPGVASVISGLTITGCTFDGRGHSTDYVLTVSGGSPAARARDWLIAGNVINGGLHAVWADRITVRGNTGVNLTGHPHVSFYRSCADNVIEDNQGLDSSAPNILGTINLTATGEGGPVRTVIRRNRLVSDTFAVRAEGGSSVEIYDNELVGPGSASPGAGIYLRATDAAKPFAHAVIRRNRIVNFGSVALKVDGNGSAALSLLDLQDNVLVDSAGTMLGGYALNNDGQGAARVIRESGTVMLGGCVHKLVGAAPAGAASGGTDQSWVVP